MAGPLRAKAIEKGHRKAPTAAEGSLQGEEGLTDIIPDSFIELNDKLVAIHADKLEHLRSCKAKLLSLETKIRRQQGRQRRRGQDGQDGQEGQEGHEEEVSKAVGGGKETRTMRPTKQVEVALRMMGVMKRVEATMVRMQASSEDGHSKEEEDGGNGKWRTE